MRDGSGEFAGFRKARAKETAQCEPKEDQAPQRIQLNAQIIDSPRDLLDECFGCEKRVVLLSKLLDELLVLRATSTPSCMGSPMQCCARRALTDLVELFQVFDGHEWELLVKLLGTRSRDPSVYSRFGER